MALVLKPGTDGALACAVMHVLFRDGLADRDYLARYTDVPRRARGASADARRRNGRRRSPGCRSPRSRPSRSSSARRSAPIFRLGYGFTRQRNGAVNMHAALCIAGGHRRLAA